MAKFYFHVITDKDGLVHVRLMDQDLSHKWEGIQYKTFPVMPVVENGIVTLMNLEKWLRGESLSNLLEAVFAQGYEAGQKSAKA